MSKVSGSIHEGTDNAINDMRASDHEKERADAEKGKIKAQKYGRDAALEIW